MGEQCQNKVGYSNMTTDGQGVQYEGITTWHTEKCSKSPTFTQELSKVFRKWGVHRAYPVKNKSLKKMCWRSLSANWIEHIRQYGHLFYFTLHFGQSGVSEWWQRINYYHYWLNDIIMFHKIIAPFKYMDINNQFINKYRAIRYSI